VYLVRKSGGGRAHRWNGVDTHCRMASTGGLKMSKYVVAASQGSRQICQMCDLKSEDGAFPHAKTLDEQFNQIFQR
jgi:hypothetical protein